MENYKNRIGSVEVSQMFVHDFEQMTLLFSRFIPLSCAYDFLSGVFTYKGYSPEFDIVNEGDKIPTYEFWIQHDPIDNDVNNTKESCSFKKV